MAKDAERYGLDGFAFFPETKGRLAIFDLADHAGVEKFQLLPELVIYDKEHPMDTAAAVIKRALKDPRSARVNGQVLFSGYSSEEFTPAQWKEMLTELRERTGPFLFVPSLATATQKIRIAYLAGRPITQQAVEDAQQFLRSYLDVCDGIYFNYPPALQNPDGTFDDDFYRNICIPIFQSVLTEPKYKDKLFGLSAYRSHFNPDHGRARGFLENLTRTLRSTLSIAMEAQPDFINLPEWDEFNENTVFMPTIFGGTTTGRIIRYYTSKMRGTPLQPMEGDNTAVPNLILSSRKTVVLGEVLEFELLHIPDSSEQGEYTARLSLVNEDGKVVKQFDPLSFKKGELTEHRLSFPTEEAPSTVALSPQLVIEGDGAEPITINQGLHHTQIRATWNWDYLAVRQPLRDLPASAQASLTASEPQSEDGSFLLTANASVDEEIEMAEILGDDDVVYAYDQDNEFSRADESKDIILIDLRALTPIESDVEISVAGSTPKWITNFDILHKEGGSVAIRGGTVKYRGLVSSDRRWLYLVLDKKDRAEASITARIDGEKFSWPVADIFKEKMSSRLFGSGVHATLSPYQKQIDLPVSVNKKDISFKVRVWPEIVTEQYHLQLTTKTGKVFRSGIALVPWAREGNEAPLRIYSSTRMQGMNVNVRTNRIPDIAYEFSPARGNVLLTKAGRPFYAALGGLMGPITGRGTDQMQFWIQRDSIKQPAPRWVGEPTDPMLDFNGHENFLLMPIETLPHRGSFTITMEFKLRTSANQTLLAGIVSPTSPALSLSVHDGRLTACFYNEARERFFFDGDLSVPTETWNTLEVRYDFENMTLRLNGEERTFPCKLPARNASLSLIGPEKLKWPAFDGWLRKLEIRHNGLPWSGEEK